MRTLAKQNNEELIRLIKAGIDTQDNYEKLYKQNRGFIYQIVIGRVNKLNDIDDLMQYGFIALVKAVESYDFELEKTNFLQILKYSVLNVLRDNIGGLPARTQDEIYKYKKAYDKLYNELGQKPKNYQIMQEMNISLEKLQEIQEAYRFNYYISLDEPINEEGDITRLDLYANEAAVNFDESIFEEEIRQALNNALARLPDTDRQIINRRYFQNVGLKEIGEEMQVSPERIRQYESKALRKLRQDTRLTKKVIDYTEVSNYVKIGIRGFKRTHTSSTEEAVLRREKLREREIKNNECK